MQHGQAVSDHNRHVICDSGITGAAPDKGNDPRQWWKQTGGIEREEEGGMDGWMEGLEDIGLKGGYEDGQRKKRESWKKNRRTSGC